MELSDQVFFEEFSMYLPFLRSQTIGILFTLIHGIFFYDLIPRFEEFVRLHWHQ